MVSNIHGVVVSELRYHIFPRAKTERIDPAETLPREAEADNQRRLMKNYACASKEGVTCN